MKGYKVTKQMRFIKCHNKMDNTLGTFYTLTEQVRDQSQRLIYFWWKVHCRVEKNKAEAEAKRKAAAKKKKKKKGKKGGYNKLGSTSSAAGSTMKKTTEKDLALKKASTAPVPSPSKKGVAGKDPSATLKPPSTSNVITFPENNETINITFV